MVNIKSAAEIAIMREAGRINAEALEAAKAAIAPGVSTLELNEAVEAVHRKYGVYSPFKNYPGPYPFPASICASVNEELVHGIPDKRKLKEGDIVSIDCGTVYQGFVGDSAFTVGVGEITPLAQKLIEVTKQALDAAIAQMVPGNYLGDIGAAVEALVLKHGFHVTHLYTGHGVGREMHESPMVPNYGQPGQGILLREGMTLAIEPMVLVGTRYTRELKNQWTVISRDRSLTAHQEHTVAIRANGPEILTQL
ncbi:MAG: type I methionyl aminopeptidase [Chloroflexi bacterium]|nr:type I methionyl aminopeptidase [Chloroflexota bacterium]